MFFTGNESENDEFVDASEDIVETVETPPEPALRRSTRIRRPPQPFWQTSGQRCNLASETQADSSDCEINFDFEPQTFKQAINSDEGVHWKNAALDEMKSLEKHNTWELVDLPVGKKAIGCRWVFKRKLNKDGEIERYKARLVAKGYAQTYGVDYEETFAPVAKFKSIRTIVAIACELDLELHQMDVKTAFLNGDLEEEVYMKQPDGFVVSGSENKVCKLKKSLYGLKQAPRAWNNKIDGFLKSLGFKQSNEDFGIYIRNQNGEIFIISVYVDDLILASNSMKSMNEIKQQLSSTFEMSDLGELEYCLGVQVIRDRKAKTIKLSQEKYINEVLQKFNMQDAKAVSTPQILLDNSIKSKPSLSSTAVLTFPYRQAVGKLMYASLITRADIATAVGYCSRYQQNPKSEHIIAVKRILRYLAGTRDLGLLYKASGNNKVELIGYSDADYAGCIETRRSTSGYVFKLCGAAVSWRTAKQECVTTSTVESEYVALKYAVQEAVWYRRFLKELGFPPVGATLIHEDNQGCIKLAKNPSDHKRTKHIDICYHYSREKVLDGTIRLAYCRTDIMAADMFTKPLAAIRFSELRTIIGMHSNIQSSGSVKNSR